jgi:hypothetical protein
MYSYRKKFTLRGVVSGNGQMPADQIAKEAW